MENQFLIVGQGIAGSLLAYDMYKAGLQFKIVSSPDESMASDLATRRYNPAIFDKLAKNWNVDELLPVMTNLYKDIEKELGQQFLYPIDFTQPLSDKEIKVWNERIFDGDFSDYMESADTSWIKRGIDNFNLFDRVGKSGYLDLAKLLAELKSFFREKGHLLEANFKYQDIGFINGHITWRGVIAKTIVFCEGHHATKNPYFKSIPFVPTKGELIEIECEELAEEYIIDENMFVMPMGNSHFKVGATYDYSKQNGKSVIDSKADLLERLNQLLRLPYKILNHWSGIRPAVSDRRPVLGCHPDNQHIAVFNGLGTKGVILAPYFAREMMYSLVNRNYILDKEIDIRRFLNASIEVPV
ncbi:NAD(P)/FAD-dependent oxidoreductase [Marinifilum caeruleilacunae]|uniref:FAD-binding oxidoreductase n=1 Tax=Marinifilum caeruleilacunae TaxID=2499076 RepID=A0ABX1WZ01_9BACT|nr:FAD-dependent oxidoreductase [Marinifilum caeruleilacunae]NOU61378.1 FAD-binding oxidoreductase [Marinifilum caeruleilacunae]